MRDKGEPVRLSRNGTALAAVTARGGIRIAPPATLRPFAYETTTRESWSGRVALCLPDEQCAMNGRRVLTELAPDADALRSEDRGAILFDLGLGARQVDVCVRVSDPDVAARLRVHAGQAVFAPGNPAMGVVLAASPHRVFVSRLGRAEVFAPNSAGRRQKPGWPAHPRAARSPASRPQPCRDRADPGGLDTLRPHLSPAPGARRPGQQPAV